MGPRLRTSRNDDWIRVRGFMPGTPPSTGSRFLEFGTPASGVGVTYIPDGLIVPIVGYTQVSTSPLSAEKD
jgi:hypothetical protein